MNDNFSNVYFIQPRENKYKYEVLVATHAFRKSILCFQTPKILSILANAVATNVGDFTLHYNFSNL